MFNYPAVLSVQCCFVPILYTTIELISFFHPVFFFCGYLLFFSPVFSCRTCSPLDASRSCCQPALTSQSTFFSSVISQPSTCARHDCKPPQRPKKTERKKKMKEKKSSHRGNFKILFPCDLKHPDNIPQDHQLHLHPSAISRGKDDNVFLFSVPLVNIAARIN